MNMSLPRGYFPQIVWGISIVAAIAYIPLCTREHATALRSLIKTIPLVGFATIATYHHLPFALILALAFSAGGDLALSRPGDTAFLIGLISFALGHVSYILLFSRYVKHYTRWTVLPFLGLAISTEFWLAPFTEEMKWPVRAYVIIICIMAITAVNLPQETALKLATLGALCFLASDLILSLVLFRFSEVANQSGVADYALWSLYVMGQAFILMSFLNYQYALAFPQETTATTATTIDATTATTALGEKEASDPKTENDDTVVVGDGGATASPSSS